MSDPNDETSLYPEPTIVVGVGRFGLGVVERVGDDWRSLSAAAGDDPSLKNLRLLSVRADADVDDETWSQPDRDLARIATAAGEDDLPTLAVHWAIVRSLGLVRYRHGTYQFALPQDGGVVEKGNRHNTRRRRYFKWISLDSDPLRAVEELHQLANEDPEVDLFLTPIVERVFHGQSPRIVLHLIGRCRSLLNGCDPSPWPWIRPHLPKRCDGDDRHAAVVEARDQWLSEDDRSGFLDGLVPPPLSRRPSMDGGDAALEPLCVPRSFWPIGGDLETPLSPRRFLRVDWETSGWVTDELDDSESIEFTPVDSSLYRLGFFDHDASGGVDDGSFDQALHKLGRQVQRGLLRIWLDLCHERRESDGHDSSNRRRAGADQSIEQCLEILGELVVEPIVEHRDDELLARPRSRSDRWVDGPELPERPSARLREAVVDTESAETMPERPLLDRFQQLGLHFDGEELGRRPLFRELEVEPAELDEGGRLTPFRRIVNEETRHLISFEHLKDYRQSPTRKPPRLTVYVVADMREPFVRRSLRPVLRALHQELMRAYGPLFDTSREGFDRPLSIVPMCWTPHPADAFGGDYPEANRVEEASILSAVHDLRRWVEALPGSRRCIPQIFINSRVTDNSVLGIDDAVRQTRDFLSFQTRNDLTGDAWLRETAVGFDTDDLFSTFSCVQIDFPAERAREYLANRFGREALMRLRETGRSEELGDATDDDDEAITPPPDELMKPSKAELRDLTADAARRLGGEVEDRIIVDTSTVSGDIVDAMDADFEDYLFDRIHDAWRDLSRNRGAMDDMVDQLRRDSAQYLVDTLEAQRHRADHLIEKRAARGGLKSARAEFRRQHERSRSILDGAESNRRRAQQLCGNHDLPDPTPIGGARQRVVDTAQAKPDETPIQIGLLFWAIMAPVLGAPLAHGVARAFDLHQSTGPIEWVLGPAGWVVGGLLLFAPVFVLLRRHLREAVNEVRDAIGELESTVRDVVEGPRHGVFEGRPSIRSFFAARLRLTAALAERNFADHLHDRVTRDNRLAVRLFQSIEVQQRRLRQRAEALGVRPTSVADSSDRIDDDVQGIFSQRGASADRALLSPKRLIEYYGRHFPTERDVDRRIPEFLERAGGFERWRREACLSDTEALLGFGRDEFVDIVTVPVGAHPAFEDEVGENLAKFVARHYANVGFGARFVGYEGFDSDGMRRLADTSLIVHPRLRSTFEKTRRSPDAEPTTETLDVIESKILPNTAFMLSLVQGINSRSIDNLRRHETFFDRLELPDPATPWRDGPLTLVGRPTSKPEIPEGDDVRARDMGETTSGGELSSGELEASIDVDDSDDQGGGEAG